jgi:uncharacterized phiE125 gp8 family phage protein
MIVRPVAGGPAPEEPVSLALAKQHLRVTNTAEDELIALYLSAARRSIESYCERSIAEQQLEAVVGGVSSTTEPIALWYGPVSAVASVESVPPEGVRVPVVGWSASGPIVGAPAEGWPVAPAAVAITYTAGQPAAEVEAPLRQAILLLLGLYYDTRSVNRMGSIVSPIPWTVEYLLAPYRMSTGVVVA